MSTTPATRPEPTRQAALHAALSLTARPPRPSPWSAALTFGWRGMLKIKHVPEQLIDVTLTPVLFLVMFTYLFGGAMSGSTDEYLQFILPGILVLLAQVRDWFSELQPWIDWNETQVALFDGGTDTAREWAMLGSTTTIWIVLPLVIGLRFLRRSEVK